MRETLVASLYTDTLSLALGAICGVMTAMLVAWEDGRPGFWVLAALLGLVALWRVTTSITIDRRIDRSNVAWLENLYETGAWSYAFLLGMLGALTVGLNADVTLQLLAVANAVGYAVGISARNAGRPTIAIGQHVLCVLPVLIALVAHGGLPYYMLATTMVLLIPAMTVIIMNTFKVLRESVDAAESNARLADKMQVLARTDIVTGLYNRAGLNHHLVHMVSNANASGSKLALFWLDLDRFKEVNDTLGHPVGDRVLAEVGKRLKKCCPAGSYVGRFGGDEFIIIAPVENDEMITLSAQSILNEITRAIRIDGGRLNIGTSIGISRLPQDGGDVESLMQAADLALYRSKVNGRNQFSFFEPAMTRNLVRRREIESELRLAIQREELSIFFQPILDLQTGKIRSFEALVRWFHPEKGELRPDEFIPVAEETGVIITLGNWITQRAAEVAAQWPEHVSLAVNLSPVQLRAPGAALGILNALRASRLSPGRLELEVTESVFLEGDGVTENFMAELTAAGVRFALDDFGTGYSSLSYLHKYPFGKIKVDRSFVSGPNVGKKSDAIIRAVAEMAQTLDMEIVAEGLETVEQVKAVREAGCSLGQGYYFSRAVPDYLAAMLLAEETEREAPLRRIA